MNTKKETIFKKDFILVVVGQIISLFGNAILRFALPLYLLRKTGSSSLFGAVNAMSFLPMIIFSLVGGVLADRVNKRNIMVGLDFGTAILILSFYLLHGQVPLVPLMIVCLMLLYGISGTYQPSVQASIPILVSNEKITQANAVINMVSTLSGLLGPVIGGILFGIWGIVPILIISIGCFVFSAVMEVFIHVPNQCQKSSKGIFTIIKEDLKESWRYIKLERPVFISVVVVLALFNLVLSAAMIIGIPVMVVNILGMNDAQLGITQGALGLGGLAGGIMAGVLGDKIKLKQGYLILIICSAAAGLMGAAILPFIPRLAGYILITAMSFVAMAASTQFTVMMCAAVQKQTPLNLIGKIMAFILAVANCVSPIGQAVYGVLFDVCGDIPYIVMLGSAVIALIISLYSKKMFIRLNKEME